MMLGETRLLVDQEKLPSMSMCRSIATSAVECILDGGHGLRQSSGWSLVTLFSKAWDVEGFRKFISAKSGG